MNRISRQVANMETAHVWSKRSTCARLNVGAIIVEPITNNIVSIGYNGRPSGKPHCQGNTCPGRLECHETIHAEINALKKLPVGYIDLDMYCTDSPCQHCAQQIIARGIFKRVFFDRKYRDETPLQYLLGFIEVYRVTPAGYVIRYEDGEIVTL